MEKESSHTTTYAPADFEKYDAILRCNVYDPAYIPQQKSMGDILLTGATGFLGSHILDQFMQRESGKIYCLVRGDGQRLFDILRYYFGEKYTDSDRIIPIIGELATLGQVDIPHVDMVIHTAADVKHYGSYDHFYAANVAGTQAVIAFAKRQKAKLIHISTLSVSGDSIGNLNEDQSRKSASNFSEQNLFIGRPLDNVYVRSKFEAERAVLDAMLDGLQANIIRIGNLTNRRADGVFQRNFESNAFAKLIKSLFELGLFPDYLRDSHIEFSPVDDVAVAILGIAEYFNEKYSVFHLNNDKVLPVGSLVEFLRKLQINMRFVSAEELLNQINNPTRHHIKEAFINYISKDGKLLTNGSVQSQNEFTVQYLRQLGYEWPDIGVDYLKKYITYFKQIGYLEV